MKRIFFYIGISFLLVGMCSSSGRGKEPWEEETFAVGILNLEIRHSMEENDRQKELNSQQSSNTAIETVNNEQWKDYRTTAQKIQDRLRIVDFTLQAIPTGYVISQKAEKIRKTQEQIFREIRTAPQSIGKVLPKQLKFADDLQMIVRFLTGIVISYGAINQMEKAERQILLNHALKEVDNLDRDANNMLTIIRVAKEKAYLKQSRLNYYINRDKEIVKSIVKNFKSLWE